MAFVAALSASTWLPSPHVQSKTCSNTPCLFLVPLKSSRVKSNGTPRNARPPIALASTPDPSKKALIFDCDGVIVESEELHRVTYNQCWAAEGLSFEWSVPFYEMLQNSIGGGREKMRWYFTEYGWPARVAGASDDPDVARRREDLLDTLVKTKTALYRKLIEDGEAVVRPGVLRLMDEAAHRGLRLAICSAANKEAVRVVLDRLVGPDRLAKFDLIIAGDMVSRKKPDPLIYNIAREKLQVSKEDCVVIEDSQIGLQAGLAAGMNVVITHTPYTKSQVFDGATAIYPGLGDPNHDDATAVITVDSLFPELASSPATV